MKTKIVLSSLAVMMFSASALASTPASYDTKFNVRANVPDSAHIVTPDGKPVTDVDIELTANVPLLLSTADDNGLWLAG